MWGKGRNVGGEGERGSGGGEEGMRGEPFFPAMLSPSFNDYLSGAEHSTQFCGHRLNQAGARRRRAGVFGECAVLGLLSAALPGANDRDPYGIGPQVRRSRTSLGRKSATLCLMRLPK